MSTPTCILFVGDVVGGLGRRTLLRVLPSCAIATPLISSSSTARTSPAGWASRPSLADEMFAAGVDVITLGNHTYRHREIYAYLDDTDRIVRPANYPAQPAGSRLVRGDERTAYASV